MEALLRLYCGSITALSRLYASSMLLRRQEAAMKPLLLHTTPRSRYEAAIIRPEPTLDAKQALFRRSSGYKAAIKALLQRH
jgi:hypothetical protein